MKLSSCNASRLVGSLSDWRATVFLVWAASLLLLTIEPAAARRHRFYDGDSSWPYRRPSYRSSGRADFHNELDYSTDPSRVDPKVYDQGDCDTGWAFAMAGQLEGQEGPAGLLRGNSIQPKSKQQLINCNDRILPLPNDYHTEQVETFLKRNAIALERDMPLEAGPCTKSKCIWGRDFDVCTTYKLDDAYKPRVIRGWNGTEIEEILNVWGPVAWFYRGPAIGPECLLGKYSGRSIEGHHAILLVGHGSTHDGVQYFKFKNSFGPEWGDKGYGYMRRHDPKCNISGSIRLWRIKGCEQGRGMRHWRG